MTPRRHATAVVIILTTVVGCTAPQTNPAAPESAVPDVRATVVQFAPEWMGLVPDQPYGWQELNRRVNGDFQQFGLKPTDETQSRFGCNGCAPWTVDLTAYAPGKFDPTEARTGRPVSVNADGDGFLVDEPQRYAATLTWQYAESAWATVRGMTTATTELDRMLDLARALQPVGRTPIRLPLTMANLPGDMPLAEIDVDTHRDEPAAIDYGTRIEFAGCGLTTAGATRDCYFAEDGLSVHIASRDFRPPTGGVEHHVVPMTVGGRDGHYDETMDRVSVPLRPGMLAEFDVGHRDRQAVENLLASVSWAADPGNEATWPAVSDWAK